MMLANLPGDWIETAVSGDRLICEAQLTADEIREVKARAGCVLSFRERALRADAGGRRRWQYVAVERPLLTVHERADGWVDATFGPAR